MIVRFFGPAVSPVRSFQRKQPRSAPSETRPLASHSNISGKVREAGTLPRSPRSNWRAAKPDAPILRPSGTDSMLVFAACARDHTTLNRRLELSARIPLFAGSEMAREPLEVTHRPAHKPERITRPFLRRLSDVKLGMMKSRGSVCVVVHTTFVVRGAAAPPSAPPAPRPRTP